MTGGGWRAPWMRCGAQGLWLHGNLLTSLPNSLAGLTALRQLSLSGNQLAALPSSPRVWEGMAQLEDLAVAGNALAEVGAEADGAPPRCRVRRRIAPTRAVWCVLLATTPQVPEGLGALRALRKLTLNGNQLSSLPASLAGLSALQELWLQGNRLEQLPETLGQLKVRCFGA